jgi:hypothetical protein
MIYLSVMVGQKREARLQLDDPAIHVLKIADWR